MTATPETFARRVPIASLLIDPRNARAHPDANRVAVRASLAEHGQVEAVVVQSSTRRIIGGNCRVEELIELGVSDVWVHEVDCDDATADRLALRLNRTAELAGWHTDILSEILAEQATHSIDLADLGWGAPDLDDLPTWDGSVGGFREPVGEGVIEGVAADIDEIEDVIPELPAEPITKPGEIIELGPHRLICGDCRDPEVVARLFDGAQAAIAMTSPPYASQRTYDESSGFKPIKPDAYVDWFEVVQANVAAHLADGGSWFVNIKAHAEDGARHLYVMDLVLAHARQWGWRFVDELCWQRKGVPGAFVGSFKNGWEPVHHFARGPRVHTFNPRAVGHHGEFRTSHGHVTKDGWITDGPATSETGIALPSNVLQFSVGSNDRNGHTAPFPTKLPEFFIKAFTDPAAIVFDPFMGSGTTLMAAERNDRIAYGCEISPGYCDIIRARFEGLDPEA